MLEKTQQFVLKVLEEPEKDEIFGRGLHSVWDKEKKDYVEDGRGQMGWDRKEIAKQLCDLLNGMKEETEDTFWSLKRWYHTSDIEKILNTRCDWH